MPTSSLQELIQALRDLPPGDPCDRDVLEVIRTHRVDPQELERYVVWNDEHYTRHLVYRDDRYQMILLGWGVGQVTPVHDHDGQRCWMLVDRGRLEITDFAWKEGGGPPRLLNHEVIGGETGSLHVDMCACVHRIENRGSWGERAMSLHIYSRPFSRCGTYCTETGTREVGDLQFDSVGPMAAGI